MSTKLFMSAGYSTNDYPQQASWSSTPTNLTQLAQTSQFADILGDAGFTWVFLNCWAFTGFGTGDAWKAEVNTYKTLIDAEYTEIYNLAAHLLTTYNNSGRTFVIQNWEGDWALTEGLASNYVPPRRPDYMMGWLRARIRAVEEARRDSTSTNVRVLSGVECNLVQDALTDQHAKRVIRRVLPRLSPDIVSYSCWDAFLPSADPWRANQAAMLTDITARMTSSLDAIKAAAPNASLVIGEAGLPDAEIPVGYTAAAIMQHIYNLANARGDVDHFILWNCWDNESPRDFSCIDSGDNLSGMGAWVNTLLGGIK